MQSGSCCSRKLQASDLEGACAGLLSGGWGALPCRPDGQKKAYVRLTPDYDALDVANKIGEQGARAGALGADGQGGLAGGTSG